MGILDWLGLKRKKKDEARQAQEQVEKPKEEEKKAEEWQMPGQLNFMSDSEKLDMVLKGVYSIYDELKPRDNAGNRVSRLGLVLEGLSVKERGKVKKILEDLDIDDVIVSKVMERPLTIEELSAEIKKSYGYTASRLRFLKKGGRVARIRDPATNKYKYAGMAGSESVPDALVFHPEQKKLEL